MAKFACGFLMMLVATQGVASASVSVINEARLKEQVLDKQLAKTGLKENVDDITSDQSIDEVTLSVADLHHAKVWELTAKEEKRYKLLMQNKSAVYYEGLRLTPIDILGINARNSEERERFAALSARFEAQKVGKNLAWNNAFYKAYQREIQGLKVLGNFDPSPYSPHAYKPLVLSNGDILNFFIKKDSPVTTIIPPMVRAIKESFNTTLNITVIDADEEAVQLWANNHNIPYELVTSGRITLNLGDSAFNSLKTNKKLPLLLLSKNGRSSVVDLGEL